MRTRYVVAAVALLGFGTYLTHLWSPSATPPEVRIVQPVSTLPADRAALSGVWESVGSETIHTRLVVEEIHDQWAAILLVWGDHPEGQYPGGYLRGKAKVQPDGTLHLHQLGEISFRLSEDWNSMIATQERGGRLGVVAMRRVPPETALTALSGPQENK